MKSRKGFTSSDLAGVLGIILLVILTCVFFAHMGSEMETETYTVTISTESKVKEAIGVESVQNKVIEVRSLGIGGGVGTGMGTAQINCKSIKQFLELRQPEERIYTSLERESSHRKRILVRHYSTFMENRSGIITYSEKISPEIETDKRISYIKIIKFNEKTATFEYEVYVN